MTEPLSARFKLRYLAHFFGNHGRLIGCPYFVQNQLKTGVFGKVLYHPLGIGCPVRCQAHGTPGMDFFMQLLKKLRLNESAFVVSFFLPRIRKEYAHHGQAFVG